MATTTRTIYSRADEGGMSMSIWANAEVLPYKKREEKPEAIYLGFSSHDCESWHQCPICNHKFGSWSLERNENGNRYCPKCKTELDGLE